MYTAVFDDGSIPVTMHKECDSMSKYSRYYNFDKDLEWQEHYNQKISRLKAILAKKQQGIALTPEEIAYAKEPLVSTGIIDEDGNLTPFYRGEEE